MRSVFTVRVVSASSLRAGRRLLRQSVSTAWRSCRRVVTVALVVAAAACAIGSPVFARGVAGQQVFHVTTKGFGPVRVGMTAAQASSALGVRLVLDEPNEDCRYATPASGYPGVSFMLIAGRVARVDVSTSDYSTPSGARVGWTEAQIKALYPGRIEVSRNHYDDKGHYLAYVPKDAADKGHRIIFETDGSRVTGIRAGRIPEVQFVEGCS